MQRRSTDPHTVSVAALSLDRAGSGPSIRVPGHTVLIRASVASLSARRATGRSRPSRVMTISISPGAAIDLQSPQPMHSPFSTISLSDKGAARGWLMLGDVLSSKALISGIEPRRRVLDRLARPRGIAGGARNETAKARLR